ncbi:MAG: hypothetical protein B6U87_03055 [Candidatus Aenigmarchaeota archaeon ex4484_52]|nr:MAG: hypothetical protein B6U87_03055 [Candidatus Aenigmarchaeota archaeon ex4484_52]
MNQKKIISKYKNNEITLLGLLEEIKKTKRYLSKKTLEKLSMQIQIPVSKLYSIATFYSFFPTTERGKYIIRVCNSPSCYLNNSKKILKILKKELKIDIGQITPDKKFSIELASCIGCCDCAPAMMINDIAYTNLNGERIKEIIRKLK